MIERNIKQVMKLIAALLVATLIVFNGPAVYAYDLPSAPSAPTPPPEPTPAPIYEEPAPTPPPAPSWQDPDPTTTPEENQEQTTGDASTGAGVGGTTSETSTLSGESAYGVVGDTNIETGDATNTANLANDLNSNLSASNGDGVSGVVVANDGNGADSTNSGSATIINDNNTYQDNSATLTNDLEQSSISGENSASGNVGNSTITSGDSNTTGTIVNAVNTNIDGVGVVEFNVVDDQLGDIILNFSSGCLIGCSSGDTSVINSENGADSTNSGDVTTVTNNNTFQTNDATVENNMTLDAISGSNATDSNTGGDSTIETGDSNVSANAITFANNNIEGNVIYAVVNIFGDLVGDIILPELTTVFGCCALDTSVINSGNGADSTNTGTVDQSVNNELYQFNSVELENNLVLDANSGGNDVSKNTGGDSSVETGDTSIEAQVLNILNSNLAGGNYWLVLVNQAGQWIGKILGAPDGSTFAGSDGFEFVVDEFGQITVVNSGNGAGSTNTGSVSNVTNNTLVQSNDAHIVNNLDLTANSGDNSASKNTGGNSKIVTGDANIIANIVNFVNNNISGGSKLLVTVVNVFGSWIGNFVGPGQHQESSSQGVGGASASQDSQSQSSSGQSSGGSSGGASITAQSQTGSSPAQVIGSGFAGVLSFGSGSEGNQVPSLSIPVPGSVAGDKKTVNVNIAWILFGLFPLGIVTTLIRRRKFVARVVSIFL